MIQSLHILRKDIRHLWLDLSLYVALLIASSITTPMGWNGANASNTPLHIFIGLLKIVIPIIWLVMIARLIHDESLVGDTQFWITRPYRWTSLLGAKLLFIVLCLVLPFALNQWAMVLQAGVNPLHTIPGQLLGLLQTALIVWLTFTVVASVTSTIQRMFMSMLAVGIFWGAALTILGSTAGTRMPLPFASETFAIVIGGFLVGILLYQYARRNTFASRISLVSTALLFVALFACLVEGVIQAPINFFVRHHYPLSTDGSLRLAFDPSSRPSQNNGEGELSVGKLVIVRLPVSIQGLDPTAQLDNQNASFAIDAPGYHYTSPWRPANLRDDNLMLFIPQRVLDKAHGSNVRMHLSEVAQRMLPGTPQTVTAANDFLIPGNGACHMLPNLFGNNVSCRYSFEIASRTMIRTTVADASCSSSSPTHVGIETLAARSPVNGPDPTIEIPLHLGGAVCPGTPITFTPYHPAENFRLELDIPSISLDRYLVR
jgi:hypothetical protein